MQQVCIFSPVGTSLGWPAFFVLRLPARPFLGLAGEAVYPPHSLPDIAIKVGICPVGILEGVLLSYICSETSMLSNIAQVSL